RDRGTVRTSTTSSICTSRRSSTNSGIERVECPMVKNGYIRLGDSEKTSRLGKGTSSVRDAHPAANFPVLISKPAPFVQDHRPYYEHAKQDCQCADRVSSH